MTRRPSVYAADRHASDAINQAIDIRDSLRRRTDPARLQPSRRYHGDEWTVARLETLIGKLRSVRESLR